LGKLAIGLVVLVAVAGCATRGTRFDVDSVDRITVGVTTQADCKRWFGGPMVVRQNASGRIGWGYEFEETQTRSTGTVTRIARSLGSIFGWRWYYPPVDVTYEKTTAHRLTILFNSDGTVADFSYEREVTPSQRIR